MSRKINPKSMKQINKAIILRNIIETGAMSRTELAKATGLANSAVWRIVQELENESLIEKRSYLKKTATKGAVVYGPSKKFACSIIVDVQVTHSSIALGFLDKSWKIIETFETNGLERFLEKVDRIISTLSTDEMVNVDKTILTISVPGVVNQEGQILVCAPNLNWSNVNLLEIFSKYGFKVIAENDANLSLLAEWFFSQDVRRSNNAFFLYFGEGIGGALIINGKIIKGKNFAAGEVGHSIVNVSPSGYVEVESLLSISQLIERFEKASRQKLSGTLKEKFDRLIGKWRASDKLAVKLVEEFTNAIAVTLLNIGYIVNPDVVIFGGIVNNLWENLGQIIHKKLQKLDKYNFIRTCQLKKENCTNRRNGNSHFTMSSSLLLYHNLFLLKRLSLYLVIPITLSTRLLSPNLSCSCSQYPIFSSLASQYHGPLSVIILNLPVTLFFTIFITKLALSFSRVLLTNA
ncbi:ROK family protein [Pseudothermotoga thermarum DSM 5069]|uniref:ROK family protein n=1 Tax=Pseudothermotoga thermarum DSM 5069 TaxID=688269 RepID=F7YUY7_9THEM|nr:ROK family protein [Pseudothermotoga thermarum DSM 5069]